MKRIMLLIMALILVLSGCVSDYPDEERSFIIKVINRTDTDISWYHSECYRGSEQISWEQASYEADHPRHPGEDIELIVNEYEFYKDPDRLTGFILVFFFNDTQGLAIRCRNALQWTPEYGQQYEVSLTGDAENGYFLEAGFEARSIDNLADGQNNTIGMEVFRQLLINDNGNLVFSPLSLETALSMLFDGARGETLEQFRGLECGVVHSFIYPVDLANSLWIDDSLKVRKEYETLLWETYGAEVYNCDLAGDTYKKINSWVEDRTNKLIRDLLDGPLDADCALALINTLYFKAAWLNEMEDAGKHLFVTASGKPVSTDFIRAEGNFDYISTDEYEGIIIPYEDESISFVAVKGVGLTRLGNYQALAELIQQKQTGRVSLAMPSFEIETSVELKQMLAEQGLTAVFDPLRADLSGIADTSQQNLYVSRVLQKSRIIVSRQGTEAASATAIVGKNASGFGQDVRYITFDQPFVYAIIADGCVLFAGQLNDPTAR